MPRQVVDAKGGVISQEIEGDEYLYEDFYSEPWPDCPTCGGRGVVNPLTAPEGFFCVSTTDCPTCDGSGECP